MTTIEAVRERTRAFTFPAVATILVTFLAASAAPSPLYVVYQQQWHFSASTLTLIFAVYVAGLLAALLVLGALSDHVGRRPVLGAAIALEAVALLLFVTAGDVPALLAARLVQGIATGAALTTLGATLVDLDKARAGLINGIMPPAGLAMGALGCGALVQYAPDPTRLVYALLLAAMGLAALVVATMPETAQRRPGGLSSLIPRLGVAPRLRRDMLAIVPIIVASWALGGLYLSLGPSVAAGVFGLHSHLIGGLVVTLLCGPGAVAALLLRRTSTPRVLALAGILLTAGVTVSMLGVEQHGFWLAAAGTLLSGVGFGAAALGQFGVLAAIAAPHERAELFTFALVVAYTGFSVPAVLAGIAVGQVGLHTTALAYGGVVVLLGVVTLAAQQRRRHQWSAAGRRASDRPEPVRR